MAREAGIPTTQSSSSSGDILGCRSATHCGAPTTLYIQIFTGRQFGYDASRFFSFASDTE